MNLFYLSSSSSISSSPMLLLVHVSFIFVEGRIVGPNIWHIANGKIKRNRGIIGHGKFARASTYSAVYEEASKKAKQKLLKIWIRRMTLRVLLRLPRVTRNVSWNHYPRVGGRGCYWTGISTRPDWLNGIKVFSSNLSTFTASFKEALRDRWKILCHVALRPFKRQFLLLRLHLSNSRNLGRVFGKLSQQMNLCQIPVILEACLRVCVPLCSEGEKGTCSFSLPSVRTRFPQFYDNFLGNFLNSSFYLCLRFGKDFETFATSSSFSISARIIPLFWCSTL